ncbi:MAG: hypothetical protein A2Y97_01465 [Nitrospirae bacterium RBG_13_39_12]|nr:MAG: hypothetical protein A2Y97_01465 [Nitrospirae bacterium RBG_13_39_12]
MKSTLGLIGKYIIGKIHLKVWKDLFSLLKRGIILQAVENIDVLDRLKDYGDKTWPAFTKSGYKKS